MEEKREKGAGGGGWYALTLLALNKVFVITQNVRIGINGLETDD
jgi:hypothetical protein